MSQLIEKFMNTFVFKKEHFSNNESTSNLSFLISIIIVQLLVLLFGKYLWNNFLVNVLTIVKPVKNIWQLWAIFILCKLFLC